MNGEMKKKTSRKKHGSRQINIKLLFFYKQKYSNEIQCEIFRRRSAFNGQWLPVNNSSDYADQRSFARSEQCHYRPLKKKKKASFFVTINKTDPDFPVVDSFYTRIKAKWLPKFFYFAQWRRIYSSTIFIQVKALTISHTFLIDLQFFAKSFSIVILLPRLNHFSQLF